MILLFPGFELSNVGSNIIIILLLNVRLHTLSECLVNTNCFSFALMIKDDATF